MRKSKLNSNLRELMNKISPAPSYDTVNREGHRAYSMPPAYRLLSILNISKLEPQFYRSQTELVSELKSLINYLAKDDPYFVAQCIVWSRCCGEGMRSINHLAAAMLAPYISGADWGKRFYGPFNKQSKTPKGGCIYRLDDMLAIKEMSEALNDTALTNAMKKGFSSVLLQASAYELSKYKKTVIDIANLVHPNIAMSEAVTEIDGQEVKVIDAIMKGLPVQAETWESANSEAGQLVAKAVKEGDMSQEEATEVLKEAKNDNWEQLLTEGKLGILAAIRNLRNILQGERQEVIQMVGNLVSDGSKIRAGKIMPYQLELASSIIQYMNVSGAQFLKQSLYKGMIEALPNFKELLPGRNLVIVDCSGSMTDYVSGQYSSCRARCIDKAAILAALLAKGADADIMVFGNRSEWLFTSKEDTIEDIVSAIREENLGGTVISSAFDRLISEHKGYDRIFLLSDNEANRGCLRSSYKKYVQMGFNPYVYCIDLAGYGTVSLKDKNGMVNFYNGYGYQMLDDIARLEFNPHAYIDRVKEVII